jgi:hydroxymethylbilane synthase
MKSNVMKNHKLTIISRKSRLALWQATWVKDQLQKINPQLDCQIISRLTAGDRCTDRTLQDMGGKDLFVKDLQQALLNQEADIAVHSLKDMSTTDHPRLHLAAICKREDARDVFIAHANVTLETLAAGATIGTSSPRRHCQLKASRPDINIKLLRGNVDTRLVKSAQGEYDAIVLAAAGVKRLGYADQICQYLDPQLFIPAIGQGALAIECRDDDFITQELLQLLDDETSRLCVTAERAVNRQLRGDCHTPLGAYATITDHVLHLSAMVGTLDGSRLIRAEISGDAPRAENLCHAVATQLLAEGAADILQHKN